MNKISKQFHLVIFSKKTKKIVSIDKNVYYVLNGPGSWRM